MKNIQRKIRFDVLESTGIYWPLHHQSWQNQDKNLNNLWCRTAGEIEPDKFVSEDGFMSGKVADIWNEVVK